MVQIQMAGHRVDRCERRIRRTLRDTRIVRIGQVGGVRGTWRRWRIVLAQLLPDYHQILVLLEDLSRNVCWIVVHVLGTVRTHFRPIGMVQCSVV